AFFFSSRRRHTRFSRDWSSDVCSSDLCCCASPMACSDAPAGPEAVLATDARARVGARHRWRALEALPWLLAIAAYFAFPDYLFLGTQVLILILFALSLDL